VERRDRAVATFLASAPLGEAGTTIDLPEEAAHHARVRRLEVGEAVRLTDGAGMRGAGTIALLTKSRLAVQLTEVERAAPLSPIELLVPVGDRDRMLWLAEKCTELGIARWTPVLFHRSRSVTPRGEGDGFRAKVRARMAAALEQSGGAWLPEVLPERPLGEALAAVGPSRRLLLDAGGEPLRPPAAPEPVALCFGPEGGLEPEEREQILAAGWVAATLGTNTLRFETAGIAAVAVLRAAHPRPMEGSDG
jgi:16S rRNA (uracil1498-N3)-methyltransferase